MAVSDADQVSDESDEFGTIFSALLLTSDLRAESISRILFQGSGSGNVGVARLGDVDARLEAIYLG
ncbi:hypothetical protein [Algoriphagus boritolerans]|uniref:hypothetical protein n=1 Tax=Algoriphagus boritolerans TaxID=308111 RepID=UPI002FCE4535